MVEPSTSLTPDELDRLEDALERWTDPAYEPGPEDSLLASPLRARLEGYREVLAATRAALPLEDVGDDVLAGVLAEARQAEAAPRKAAKAGPSLWERLRRSMLLPGVALAGSAALLLWLVQPSEELRLEGAPADEAPAKREEARLAPEAGPAPAAPNAAEPSEAIAPAPAAEKADDKEASAGAAASAPVLKDMDAKTDRPKSKAVRRDEAPADEYLAGIDGDPREADKEELRDTLERAESARKRGDCDGATVDYREAVQMAGHPTERAKAMGGYALCLQQQGEDSKATKYTEAARKLWSGIDGWIGREGGSEAKKPAKSKMPPPKPKKSLPGPGL